MRQNFDLHLKLINVPKYTERRSSVFGRVVLFLSGIDMQVQDNVAVSVMENMSNIYLLQKQEALTMLAPGLDKQGTVSEKIQPWLPAACSGLRATPVPGTDHGTMIGHGGRSQKNPDVPNTSTHLHGPSKTLQW